MNRLKRPADVRASALLDWLDGCYREFAQALPPPLDQRALQYGTFAGRPSEELLAGLSGMNAVVTCMPWLFWESSRQLPDDLFLRIAWSGALCGMASVLLDHLLDEQTRDAAEATLLHEALYEAAVTGYRGLFDRGSAFWDQYERLGKEHVSGMALELSARANPSALSADGFYALASARIAPMLTTVAALAQELEQPALLPTLEASIKPVIVAGQMLDDIQDWQEDLEAGHVTYYLTRLVPPEIWPRGDFPAAEEIQASIDANWSDVEHLRLVIDWFDQGLAAVDGLACRAWVEYITEYRAAAEQHQRMLAAHHLLRTIASLPTGTESCQEDTEHGSG